MSLYCYECMKADLPDDTHHCPNCGAKTPYVEDNVRDCPAGTKLHGHYLLGKAIGRGGFGVTYIALDLNDNKHVCIKEYNPKLFSQRDPSNPTMLCPTGSEAEKKDYEDYKKRHLTEGERLQKKLAKVPGVVRCFDTFEENNTAYVVLEYLQGSDLKQYITKHCPDKCLSIKDTIRMTIRILEILSVVHKRGMIHRDISPDNIFLCDTGEIKLIDFGAATDASETTIDFEKKGYTPPEMLNGSTQDHYTDIYSAGALIYFLLTGKRPVKKSDGRLACPADSRSTEYLNIVFQRATELAPNDRYQEADAMIRDLKYVLKHLPAENSSTKRRLLIAFLSALVAGLIGVILMAGATASTPPSPSAPRSMTTKPASSEKSRISISNDNEAPLHNNETYPAISFFPPFDPSSVYAVYTQRPIS